jgi:transposase
MTGIVRARCRLEFKQEAVRLVRGGQSLSSVATGLGVSAQSIDNWVKADAIGGLKEAKGKPVNADQMEIVRLKAELAKTRMERDILKKRRRILRGSRGKIRLYRATRERLADYGAMPGSGRECQRLPSAPCTRRNR